MQFQKQIYQIFIHDLLNVHSLLFYTLAGKNK